jgi:hypothetical protein
MNVKNVKIETSSQSATKDLQDIDAIVAVNYSIEPLRVKELYKTV